MKIAYYPGCSLHASSAFYDHQTKIVTKKLGIELVELDDWNCCGATSACKTDTFLSIALPARNLGIADASGLDELVIPCSSCYSRSLVAQSVLADNQELKDMINSELSKKVSGRVKILSIVELLLKKVNLPQFDEQVKYKLEGFKPACYYGCLLTRFPYDIKVSDNVENPQGLDIICKRVGAHPVDWNYKTDCCGASATVNDTEVALKLMSKIMKDAIARGANCFVTTCPMCQLNLDAYQDMVREKYNISQRMPVYFITELVGLSLGLSERDLQIDRHLIDATGLLKEIKQV
ncbi:MAG: CoB--CoM heterodisulfide reductase iron-sulfur subunit B family protein [Thermodesulfovibrionales bacterium]|nr:CoB--CoM heterodisulfide reductase iron-sulfur subunit B family protein [Thermodesulfovibrionales bacterium]